MDEEDIFRKLGTTLKFDLQRFKKDAQKLNLINVEDSGLRSQLNFFQKEKKNQLSYSNPSSTVACDAEDDGDTNGIDRQKKSKITECSDAKTIRKQNKIFVEGVDVPEPVTSFHVLEKIWKFNSYCIANVVEKRGFNQLTPIQMQVCYFIFQNCLKWLSLSESVLV